MSKIHTETCFRNALKCAVENEFDAERCGGGDRSLVTFAELKAKATHYQVDDMLDCRCPQESMVAPLKKGWELEDMGNGLMRLEDTRGGLVNDLFFIQHERSYLDDCEDTFKTYGEYDPEYTGTFTSWVNAAIFLGAVAREHSTK